MDARTHWPAAERNRDPILEQLRQLLPAEGVVLEVSSGTGQHVAHFASQLRALRFQPSDWSDEHFDSIGAWTDHAGASNVAEPLLLDVTWEQWPLPEPILDVVYNANMIHIAPWECTGGLMRGAARHLRQGGLLVMYGPYMLQGQHTSESNAQFDSSLRARDPRWGVRDLGDVQQLAETEGMALRQQIQMPANNQLIIFERQD